MSNNYKRSPAMLFKTIYIYQIKGGREQEKAKKPGYKKDGEYPKDKTFSVPHHGNYIC